MKNTPTLFKAEMARSILSDNKTQTRREVKPQPDAKFKHLECHRDGTCEVGVSIESPNHYQIRSPYGGTGDRLWVKETWRTLAKYDHLKPSELPDDAPIEYAADEKRVAGMSAKWRSPLFMQERFSRIQLEIVGIRVERLRDISREDAAAEGMCYLPTEGWNADHPGGGRVIQAHYWTEQNYLRYWEYINGELGLAPNNPFVWVIEFKRVAA